ncbi:Cupin domain protein [Rubripirellula lacrimiformis]|uniref:Cupin domain protein n=1 Tax=Rubripirellula lacrimiformis TaxID=1930273 RepID=A0A517NBW2_9BACT|nr:cupin domain-containing protein [Rubripirellula lacrimiformis]QDT04629.1 Cupin domain protein [Rubripirellula lacrimiformis]
MQIPQDGNLFAGTDQVLPQELIEVVAGSANQSLRIKRIVSHGQATPPGQWYDQSQHEWVAVIAGEADLRFEDEAVARTMRAGDYVFIHAHRRHRVDRTSDSCPTIWIAVFYDADAY